VTKPAISPLGLEYLTEACCQQNIEVEVVDLCFEDDPLAALQQRLAAAAPKLVGISVRNTDNCYLLSAHSFIPHLAEVVAATRRATSAPIVLGGAGFSVAPAAVMQATGVDYGVQGDGEQALPRLLQAIGGKAQVEDIPGLLWRADGGIRTNIPAWPSLADQPSIATASTVQIPSVRVAGCGPARPQRSPMKSRICWIRDATSTIFVTANSISPSNMPAPSARSLSVGDWARRFAGMLIWHRHPSRGNWPSLCGGLVVRARLGRDFSAEQILQAVKWCREYDIAVMLDLLIGGPGESQHSANESVAMAKAAKPSCVGISLGVRIYPGTRLAAHVAAQGPMAGASILSVPAAWESSAGR